MVTTFFATLLWPNKCNRNRRNSCIIDFKAHLCETNLRRVELSQNRVVLRLVSSITWRLKQQHRVVLQNTLSCRDLLPLTRSKRDIIFNCFFYITLDASSGQRNVTVWRSGVARVWCQEGPKSYRVFTLGDCQHTVAVRLFIGQSTEIN